MTWPATRTLTFAAVESSVRAHLAAARWRAFAAPAFDDWRSTGLHLAESPPARRPAPAPAPATAGRDD